MEANKNPIRIILIDDQALFRAGLQLLLESQPGFEVIGNTGNADEAFDLVTRLRPDIILFESNLAGGASLEIIPSLLEKVNPLKVILVTSSCDPQTYLVAIQMGVVGIIQKNQSPNILFKAIEKVHRGEVWIERSLMADLLYQMKNTNGRGKQNEEVQKIHQLTQREREVLSLIGKGLKNRDIATQLSISETTVSHHLTSIFNKLGVSDRLELAIYSYRFGLEKPPI